MVTVEESADGTVDVTIDDPMYIDFEAVVEAKLPLTNRGVMAAAVAERLGWDVNRIEVHGWTVNQSPTTRLGSWDGPLDGCQTVVEGRYYPHDGA